MTQKEFANAIGVGYTSLNNWCLGKNMPSMGKIQHIADYLGVGKSMLVDKHQTDKYYLNDETAQMAQEMFDNKDLRVLFDAARDASPEDLQTVRTMLLALKKKEQ